MTRNKLYYGDNLDVLQRHVPDESVSLVYLDPPFKSMRDYNILFEEQDGTRASAQIKAFKDTWQWDSTSSLAYEDVVESGGPASLCLQGFRKILGPTDMLAYLSMMAPRLKELRRVLKPTGLLYLHCDPTASHYLKVLLDSVFAADNFRNEIVWCYAGGGIPKNDFPRKHDVILRYSKSVDYFYQPDYRPYSRGTQQRGRTKVKGKYFEQGLRKEGTPVNDWWDDVPKITSPTDPEKLGYPTQKSKALLRRIIETSSQPGDIVLDPFCGCGTTIEVAELLDRPWVGIDITHLAINLIKHRMQGAFGDEIDDEYEVIGEPVTWMDAQALASEDPYQFQFWALGLVKARPEEERKGRDRGIDGRLYFHDGKDGKTKQVIFSVKSGKIGPRDVRDLRGVVEREGAEIGVLISMKSPTRDMRKEAASAGFYESPFGSKHPKVQLLTIDELLSGKKVDRPRTYADATFRDTPRAASGLEEQGSLDLD